MSNATEDLVERLSDIFADELLDGLDDFSFDRQIDWNILEICRAVGRATLQKAVATLTRRFEADAELSGFVVERRKSTGSLRT